MSNDKEIRSLSTTGSTSSRVSEVSKISVRTAGTGEAEDSVDESDLMSSGSTQWSAWHPSEKSCLWFLLRDVSFGMPLTCNETDWPQRRRRLDCMNRYKGSACPLPFWPTLIFVLVCLSICRPQYSSSYPLTCNEICSQRRRLRFDCMIRCRGCVHTVQAPTHSCCMHSQRGIYNNERKTNRKQTGRIP